MNCSRIKLSIALLCFSFLIFPSNVECAKKGPAAPAPVEKEPTIEEVTSKQLERILAEKDYVAVYWCKSPASPISIDPSNN